MNKIFFKYYLFLITIYSFSQLSAQGISVGLTQSNPVFGLTEWFNPSFEYNMKFVFSENDAISIEYTHYSDENLTGYPKDKLDLSLKHVGFLYLPRYYFTRFWNFKPVIQPGVGIYYWKGVRGAIAPNPELNIPRIDKRVLEEWNWGFKLGAGLEYEFTTEIKLDLMLNYRFIVGELWPTLQDYIELDGVSGFQSANVTINVIYIFNYE